MHPALQRYATPLTTGLFLVSLISGVALFFHLGSAYFHSMHEWLSMVLIAPFLLHLWRNWRGMMNYLRKPAFAISMAVSLAAALFFVLPATSGEGGGRPPVFALSQQVMQASVMEVAAVLDTTPEALRAKLADAGYAVDSDQQSLAEIASAAGRSTMDMAGALVGQSH